MGLRIRAKCDPMVLKQFFFPKNYEKSPCGWVLHPQTPVNDTLELQCTFLLKTYLNLDIFAF